MALQRRLVFGSQPGLYYSASAHDSTFPPHRTSVQLPTAFIVQKLWKSMVLARPQLSSARSSRTVSIPDDSLALSACTIPGGPQYLLAMEPIQTAINGQRCEVVQSPSEPAQTNQAAYWLLCFVLRLFLLFKTFLFLCLNRPSSRPLAILKSQVCELYSTANSRPAAINCQTNVLTSCPRTVKKSSSNSCSHEGFSIDSFLDLPLSACWKLENFPSILDRCQCLRMTRSLFLFAEPNPLSKKVGVITFRRSRLADMRWTSDVSHVGVETGYAEGETPFILIVVGTPGILPLRSST